MTDETSNTGKNRKPGTFVKGDPRINRKGRPKNFDQLRDLAQLIAHEEAQAGGIPLGKSVIEMILRTWAQSKNPQLQRAFIEYAFGKVPDKTELTGKDGGSIEVIHVKPKVEDD